MGVAMGCSADRVGHVCVVLQLQAFCVFTQLQDVNRGPHNTGAARIDLLLMLCWWLQLRGHGSHSELAEVEASCRYLKVLLAEDNLINMKVTAHTHPLCMCKEAPCAGRKVSRKRRRANIQSAKTRGPLLFTSWEGVFDRCPGDVGGSGDLEEDGVQ